jgi:hypothetical protein
LRAGAVHLGGGREHLFRALLRARPLGHERQRDAVREQRDERHHRDEGGPEAHAPAKGGGRRPAEWPADGTS